VEVVFCEVVDLPHGALYAAPLPAVVLKKPAFDGLSCMATSSTDVSSNWLELCRHICMTQDLDI